MTAALPVGALGERSRLKHGRPIEGAVGYGNEEDRNEEARRQEARRQARCDEERLQALRAVAEGEARCEESGEEARQEVSGRRSGACP